MAINNTLPYPSLSSSLSKGLLNSNPLTSQQKTSTPVAIKSSTPTTVGGFSATQNTYTNNPVSNLAGTTYASTPKQPTVASTPQPVTPQPMATQQMTTPSGLAVTGNPATYAGVNDSQPFQAPVKGLFPDIVTSLANRSTTASPEYTQAMKDAEAYNKSLQESLSNEAKGEATLLGQAIPLGDQEGQAQVLRNQYLKQQQALGAGFQGASNLLGAANTQQQIQQTGLGTAAGLTQPQLGAVGTQAFYNPVTGLPEGGSSANTPFGGGVAQGNVALGQQYAANVSANNQAKAVKDQITNYLDQNPTLNPSNFSDVNQIIQLLSGRVSDPRYQVLSNYLTEYVNTLAPILGVGGDTTNLKTQIAQGFVNAHQSGQSIASVLNGIEALANAKLNAQQGGSEGQTPQGGSIWDF